MKMEIWIWYHDFDGSDSHDVSLFHSQAAARGAVQAYVVDQWNEGNMDDNEMPGDLNQAVEMYFETNEGVEWYHIAQQFVDLPAPPLDKDTVDLAPQEVKAVLYALGNANYAGAAEALGVTLKQSAQIVDSTYKKLSA